jgi:hypothetical protein
MKPMLFSEEEFNVLTCFYFTVYYVKDKRAFFRNCYQWLKPEGYLILHLVDRNHFDPIVPGGKPLFLVSPQTYAKERITNSLVKFMSFQYKSDFVAPPPPSNAKTKANAKTVAKNTGEKNIAKFVEKFTALARAIKVGDGLDPSSNMGPLANARRVTAMESLVGDAVQKGAEIQTGGKRIGNTGNFFEPTVITAGSVGFTSRLTMVWSAVTSSAACTIGSTVVCG